MNHIDIINLFSYFCIAYFRYDLTPYEGNWLLNIEPVTSTFFCVIKNRARLPTFYHAFLFLESVEIFVNKKIEKILKTKDWVECETLP